MTAAATIVGGPPSRLSANDEAARAIAFYNIHTKETLRIIYKRRGRYQTAALKRIDWVLRDWRADKAARMDPKLIDLAWEIHKELGSREPIHIISGYRSPKTNTMLRKTRGGQARRSLHLRGKALDMHFPDVPIRRLRYAGLIRERGGVGYYPTSGIPFVHIDTGRVRHWPRMGRDELALLFPNGRTRHRPRRGGPLTRADTKIARRKRPSLAQQIAAYHRDRRDGRTHTMIAAARTPAIGPFQTSVTRVEPPRPRIASRPPMLRAPARLIDRPSRLAPTPSLSDRQALTRLAAFASRYNPQAREQASATQVPSDMALRPPAPVPVAAPPPRLQGRLAAARSGSDRTAVAPPSVQPTSWIAAPSYDEEHPEEMSYRPFPVLPFLTATASPHDPALIHMVHPDASRTLELLDHEGSVPPLRLRPGVLTARLWWNRSFSGKAIDLSFLTRTPPVQPRFGSRRSPLARRQVHTTR